VQQLGPGRAVIPVEGDGGAARTGTDAVPKGVQPGDDAAAGLAGGAEDQSGDVGVGGVHGVHAIAFT
jgi:hypothetical protein